MIGRIPTSAAASITWLMGKQNRHSTPSRFRILATAAPPFIDVSHARLLLAGDQVRESRIRVGHDLVEKLPRVSQKRLTLPAHLRDERLVGDVFQVDKHVPDAATHA